MLGELIIGIYKNKIMAESKYVQLTKELHDKYNNDYMFDYDLEEHEVIE